jgi:hypothetical protein
MYDLRFGSARLGQNIRVGWVGVAPTLFLFPKLDRLK